MIDVPGQALHDYYFKSSGSKLWIVNSYGPKEEMPVAIYFRQPEDMSQLEQMALKKCFGKVLDIGAGAGSHALALQEKGLEVTALDISPKAVEVMKHRGIADAVTEDIFTYSSTGFDTLLLLMNGIGLTGNTSRLKLFLQHAKTLLNKGGQLLFDSSDVAYLYEGKPMPEDRYYGEIAYRYEYKKQKTPWFNWLYIDKALLRKIASAEGWKVKLLYEDKFDQYLVRLTLQ